MLKLVLFDLDGTLLPMDLEEFNKVYFSLLAKKMAQKGYDPEKFISSLWVGIKAMMKNDGSLTNEKAFWKTMCEILGEKFIEEEKYLEDFYKNEYQEIKPICGFTEKASETVKEIKNMGFKICLATNPIFPSIGTISRATWAGLDTNDFDLITTYENSSFSKPNPHYYEEIFKHFGVSPEETLMVGNDVSDDMPAKKTGANVFLLTDCLINRENVDISVYPNGSFSELLDYVKSLA